MIGRNNAPCMDCSERTVGCHSRCEKYAAFDAANKARLKARDEGGSYVGSQINKYLARKAKEKSNRSYYDETL